MHASATALRRPGSGIRPESSAPGVGFSHAGQGRISLHVTVTPQEDDAALVPADSPHVGRWLSNDPIGISGGLNQYTAFGNNPVVFVDPWGKRADIRVRDRIESWLRERWKTTLTINVGKGWGIQASFSLIDGNLNYRVGGGLGIGLGIAYAGGPQIGGSCAWDITGSFSGGGGLVGASGTGTLSEGGASAEAGVGLGVGGGGTVTIGYSGTITNVRDRLAR